MDEGDALYMFAAAMSNRGYMDLIRRKRHLFRDLVLSKEEEYYEGDDDSSDPEQREPSRSCTEVHLDLRTDHHFVRAVRKHFHFDKMNEKEWASS